MYFAEKINEAWPCAGLCYLMSVSFTGFSIPDNGIGQIDQSIIAPEAYIKFPPAYFLKK